MKTLLQFVKFGIVGVSNTLIALMVYYALLLVGVHYLIANVISFVVSVLNAFYWNRKYVFKSGERRKYVQLTKVYVSYGVTFITSTSLMFAIVDIVGISEFIAPIVSLCITLPFNFLLNKFWAFR